MPFPRDLSHYADPEHYFRFHNDETKTEGISAILAQAEQYLPGQGKMIDVGCGTGTTLAVARTRGWEVEGVEPSAEFAAVASERHHIKVHVSSLDAISYPDGSFDFAVLAAVLEHVYEPVSLLAEVKRILRPSGVVYIEVPNELALLFRVARTSHRIRGRPWVVNLSPTFEPYHVAGFSKRSLRAAFARVGLAELAMKARRGEIGELLERNARIVQTVENAGAVMGSGMNLEAWGRRL
jgi:SAM-dependent methyltransferase